MLFGWDTLESWARGEWSEGPPHMIIQALAQEVIALRKRAFEAEEHKHELEGSLREACLRIANKNG